MKLLHFIKYLLRPSRDILYALFGYLYDFFRFFKHSGYSVKSRKSVRDYKAVKVYHRLEKSLSFRGRKPSSGWNTATDLVKLLQIAK